MSLLTNNTIQTNIIADQNSIKKEVNRGFSILTSAINRYSRLTAFLHEEAGIGEIVDTQDSNRNLRLLGRKAEDLRALADTLDAISNNFVAGDKAATDANMINHKADLPLVGKPKGQVVVYDHANFKAEYEPE